jgi:hypothetical protein
MSRGFNGFSQISGSLPPTAGGRAVKISHEKNKQLISVTQVWTHLCLFFSVKFLMAAPSGQRFRKSVCIRVIRGVPPSAKIRLVRVIRG